MPFLLFPSPNLSPALLLVPGLWIVASLAKRDPLPHTPLNVTLLLMMIMILVSILVTFDVAFSLPKLAGLILGVGVFFAIVRYGKSDRGWWVSLGLLLSIGVGFASFGLFGTHWGAKISLLTPVTAMLATRIKGLPGIEEGYNPNQLAGGLSWVVPVFVCLSAWAFSNRINLLGPKEGRILVYTLVVLTLFVGIVLVLTESRSGYLGVSIASVVMLIFARPRRWWLFSLSVLFIIVILGLSEALQSGTIPLLNDRVGDVASSTGVADTVDSRMEVWSRAIYGIQDFPLTGMGLNMFRRVAPVLYPFYVIPPDVDIGHAHNEFLQAALDLGIPGLIAFIALYLGTCWMLVEIWRLIPHVADGEHSNTCESWRSGLLTRTLSLGLGAGLLSHMIFGLTDATALGAKPGILFWMLLGLITGLFNQVKSGHLLELPFWYRSHSLNSGRIS